MRRSSLEHHVFEQVGHARLAVPFVPRADEDRQVHRDGRLGRIGKQEQPQPVLELVFGNPLDRRHLARPLGRRGGGCCLAAS